MKKIVMFSVAALALASCSQDEIISDVRSNGADNGLIAFRPRAAKASRALDLTTDNIQSFMVFGYKGSPEDIDEGLITEMTNYFGGWVEFKRDNNYPGYFNSDKPYYYPTDNSMMYFPAYAPVELNEGAEVSAPKTGGLEIAGFTVADKIDEQVDLLFGCSVGRWSESADDISMDFEHMLSKVYVSQAKNEDTRYKYEVAGVKFGNIYKSGNCKYNTSDLWMEPDADGVKEIDTEKYPGIDSEKNGRPILWSVPDTAKLCTIEYIFDEAIEIGSDFTNIMDGCAEDAEASKTASFLMLPQQLTYEEAGEGNGDDEATIVFKKGVSYVALLIRITYAQTGEIIYPYAKGVENITEEVEGVKYAWAALPVSSKWMASSYHFYNIDFSHGAGYVAPGA
ncbi:MAG: fimbrillin family protein, partial [Muribaculaceae bacterium]|nr:fimbrillin family protein [Muribaculaceae bacterium]